MSDAPHMTASNDGETTYMAGVRPDARRTSTRRRRWIAGALVALSVLAGLVFVQTSPASAYVGSNFLRNWATGRCLDGYNGDAYTWDCQAGNPFQQWQPMYVGQANGNDQVMLVNVGSGGCLARISGRYFTPKTDNACSWAPVTFEAHSVVDAWYRINLIDQSGHCVDSNDAGQAGPNPCNGGGNQMWRLGY